MSGGPAGTWGGRSSSNVKWAGLPNRSRGTLTGFHLGLEPLVDIGLVLLLMMWIVPAPGSKGLHLANGHGRRHCGDAPNHALNLTVTVMGSGYLVSARGAALTVPASRGQTDRSRLRALLGRIRRNFPENQEATVMADDDIAYQAVMETSKARSPSSSMRKAPRRW